QTQPQRDGIATKSKFNGFPSQPLGLAVEQRFGGNRRMVACAPGPAGIALRKRTAPRCRRVVTRAISHARSPAEDLHGAGLPPWALECGPSFRLASVSRGAKWAIIVGRFAAGFRGGCGHRWQRKSERKA